MLGQGERYQVDPRFASPNATLATYWEALRANDEGLVVECFDEPANAAPVRGAVWFLPPSQDLVISPPRLVRTGAGRTVANYEVRFRPFGSLEVHGVTMASELMRVRGEWRIVRALVDSDTPDWAPAAPQADI
jgi:hypothetical protein